MTAEHAYLERISLLSVHMHACTHQRGPGEVGAQARVDTSGEIQAIDDLPEGQLAYLISLNYQIQNDNEEQVAHGAVAYIAAYTVADGPALTEEQVEDFGHGGALFQVHPYIREHVATMCQRSGLTAYVLPMLLPDVRQNDPDGDNTSEA